MTIDSHQHFWKYDPIQYAWIDDSMQQIRRDFLPEDLKPVLTTNGMDACVAVQADTSEVETKFLLELADRNSFIKAVVGWVDLCADNAEERIAHFAGNEKLKGIRHIVQAERADFMLRRDFRKGLGVLKNYNLSYDILIFPNQLEAAIQTVADFPDQAFVLDHLAKPYIKNKEIAEWKKAIKKMAAFENVHCKISGMVTEADWQSWKTQDFKPYLDVAIEAFGTSRLMFGSDWPVCLTAASYAEVKNIVLNYFVGYSENETQQVFGENAAKFYNIKTND